jgi:hypothetical protein
MSSAKGFQTVWFGVLPLPDLLNKDKELGDLLQQVHMLLNFSMAGLVLAHRRRRAQAPPDRPRRRTDAHAALPCPNLRSQKMKSPPGLALIAPAARPRGPGCRVQPVPGG